MVLSQFIFKYLLFVFMIKLSQVIKDLWIKKDQLLKILTEITGKECTDKTAQISEALYKKVQSHLNKSNPQSKVLKKEEFLSWEDSFLSSMWISTSRAQEEEEISYENDIIEEEPDYISDKKPAWFKTKSNDESEKVSKPSFQTGSFTKKEDVKPADTSGKFEGKREFNKSSWWFKTTSTQSKQGNGSWGFSQGNAWKSFDKKWKWHHNAKSKDADDVKVTPKKDYNPTTSSSLKKKDEIIMWDTITVKEFSEKMWVPLPELMKKFLMNKIMVSVNSSIDYDTAALIWEELEVKINKETNVVSIEDVISWNLNSILAQDKLSENAQERCPIVTIMWHVDHGKTKLLDYLRKTNVVSWEAGWITQSIWASQIAHNGKKLTFIDTPWHELFTSLRARWAKITDVVIIVIAADEWMKQQTIEAINHAKESGVPIIVAITKMDKWMGNIDMIKWQMSEQWLVPEDWGGNVPICPVSAVTWQWVDDLLEVILLHTEILELKYDAKRTWVWVVIEAHKDPKKWVTTSLILMTWTLKVWDIIVVNDTFWKVRKLVDWTGKDVHEIHWWDPAMILWLQDIPEPGRMVEVVKSEKEANLRVDTIKHKQSVAGKQNVIQNLLSKINQWEQVQLKLIFKADSFGSLEALKYATWKIELPENIEIKVIHNDVWQITEWDLILADASGAVIIWFNVDILPMLKKKAENMKIEIKSFEIIYEIIDYIDRLAKWLVKIEEKEVYIWKLEILGIFYTKWNEMILWWKVVDWKIMNNCILKTIVWWEKVWSGRVTSLKKEKENVNELWTWHECWMKIKVNKKPNVWDFLEFYIME